jgi:HD superfamily phosphohydrolase
MQFAHNSICDRPVRKIFDSVHEYIYLTKFASIIIDNKRFHRLRNLNQLGTCKYVYPNATHSRFEHSLGTYHLAGKILQTLPAQSANKQIDSYLSSIPELKHYYLEVYNNEVHPLDMYVCELIKIAALCHDLGHGPFSHVFDDVFMLTSQYKHHQSATHEHRSGILLRMIINENEQLKNIVHENEIQFMINLINPSSEHQGFIYQIVSNCQTSLDVDKFDYLQRDIYTLNFPAKINLGTLIEQVRIIDNNFTYPEQAINDILNLFSTRHKLHLLVYNHKVVLSTQLMIVKIFKYMDKILNISKSITDMDIFCNMTDGYILNSVNFIYNNMLSTYGPEDAENIVNAYNVLNALETRTLYSLIYNSTSTSKLDVDKYIDMLYDKDDIICVQNKIGFVSGNKPNPLDSIYLYTTKNITKSTKLTLDKQYKNDITMLTPQLYQEHLTLIYYEHKHNTSRIKELRDFFQDNIDVEHRSDNVACYTSAL